MLFETLPLLDRLIRPISSKVELKLSRTLLVGVQHLLATTGSLVEALIQLGLSPDRVFMLGKSYSSSIEVVERLRTLGIWVNGGRLPVEPGSFQSVFVEDIANLWSKVLETLPTAGCDHVVILDDGGRCLSSVPDDIFRLARVSGVEQTTSGLSRVPKQLRVVEVATSAAKRILEPPMISRAVLRRLPSFEKLSHCGIIGLGNIGRSIALHLLRRDLRVVAFDRNPERRQPLTRLRSANSLGELVSESDIIFGCSGDDVFAAGRGLGWRRGDITLVSCSSEDREFRSLLIDAARDGILEAWSPLGTAVIRSASAEFHILRGGFPVNFDGSRESVPASEIQLTRALLLGGILQSVFCGADLSLNGGGGRMLDARFQAKAAQLWFETEPEHRKDFSSEIFLGFCSDGWISKHSGGVVEDTTALQSLA